MPETDTELTGYVESTGAALAEAFGVPFRFWELGAGPTRPIAAQDDASQDNDGDAPPLAEEMEARLQAAEDAVLIAQGDGRVLVGLPLGPATGHRLAATAVLEGPSPELTLRLARQVLEDLRLRQELDRCRTDLDLCAAQIGNDFEELTFLRALAEHLDVSDPSHDVWHVAEMVLPLLASVIRAESIVLVTARRAERRGDPVSVDRPVLWVGPRRLDDEACRRLVEQFREGTESQPVVRNHFDEGREGAPYPGVRKFVITSLAKRDDVVGWLVAINHLHRPKADEALWALSDFEFGTVEASLLASVASMLATHARNVELLREKEALLTHVVRAMVSAIEAKDRYTCGHSERVALVARRLGQEMGLSQTACEDLFLSALMHDLGKLGVPDAVLGKRGQLTAEERAQIEPHPEQGWAILHRVEQLGPLLPGVLYHHERYDGGGYPDRLAGQAIPLPARILAVADSYDAMVSDRPYRKGMPEEKVEQILREGSGTQWDPEVVEAFFRALTDIRSIWHAYQPEPARRRPRRGQDKHSEGAE